MVSKERWREHPTQVATLADQNNEGSQDGGRRWALGSTSVCLDAWCAMLGSTKRSILRMIHGAVDMRSARRGGLCRKSKLMLIGLLSSLRKTFHCTSQGAGSVEQPQTRLVNLFMQELYESAAEPMPDSFSATGVWDVDAMVENPDEYAQVWQPSQTLPEQIQALSATDLGVPTRHLPHGRVHDLYLQFLSWYDANVGGKGGEGHDGREAKGPASYSTFHRHWHTTWAGCLKFRKVAQHSTCQVCFELKKSMHAARGDLAAKVEYAGKLREHLNTQYQDRCLYWSLRWASRQYQDVLVIIVDSMDKTKFGIPRYGFFQRDPKN